MNRIKQIIFSISIFLICIPMVFKANAQQATPQLVVIEYENTQRLDALFKYSNRVLVYLNGTELEKAIFLALMTQENIESVKKEDYSVTVIDENPDIDRYVLLYHPAENKGDMIKEYGQVKQILKKYTLLYLNEGTQFSHEGAGAQFFEIPFIENIQPPPNATPVLPESEKGDAENEASKNNNGFILIFVISTILIGAGVGGYIYYRKKKASTSSF